MRKKIIGILALQGAVEPHRDHIEACGAEYRTVKTAKQFAEVDGFILPGGESTTMLKLIERFDLWNILAQEFKNKPVWGICAGSILMAEKVTNPEQKSFGLLPIEIVRNGYGRQIDSHITEVHGYQISHIRAPVISRAYGCEILAEIDNKIAWVKKGRYMATTFHPELTLQFPSPMHQAFIDLID
tara:strand:- start:259 stop:813 length:555 start_codon:yes stop_codon:yes gene_type:complete